ncbi:YraN family protein [Candidatus Curtissbacteria bacterium]|nr:YraN family protein [Candidatus Curtissbacteria bacterium]
MNTKSQGDTGEELACEYLLQNGYKILERNFRIRGGEIDVVALDGKTLVYIEVQVKIS